MAQLNQNEPRLLICVTIGLAIEFVKGNLTSTGAKVATISPITSPKIFLSPTTKLCAISLSHPNILICIIRNTRNMYIMFLLILCMRGCVINLYNIHNALRNTHYILLCPLLDQHNLTTTIFANTFCSFSLSTY